MIELERHIEILLLNNDCVIVPGLGGFVASHVTARFERDENMFLPPFRTLCFNQKLDVNDSLLVQSYSECYDISYPDALSRINDEVEELRQQLQSHGSYELNDLGRLFLNSEGSIEFKPCEAGILTPSLYSLSSFEVKKLAVRPADDGTSGESKTAGKANALPHKAEVKPARKDEEDGGNGKKAKTISIRLSVLRNAAAAIVAIILFFTVSAPVGNGNYTIKMSSIDNGLISRLITSEGDNAGNSSSLDMPSKPAASVTVKESAAKPSRHVQDAQTEKKIVKESAGDYYCVVLASRVTMKNAEVFANKLKRQGFTDTKVLKEEGKAAKVVFGHYASQSEAYDSLNYNSGSEHFAGAWVYHVK